MAALEPSLERATFSDLETGLTRQVEELNRDRFASDEEKQATQLGVRRSIVDMNLISCPKFLAYVCSLSIRLQTILVLELDGLKQYFIKASKDNFALPLFRITKGDSVIYALGTQHILPTWVSQGGRLDPIRQLTALCSADSRVFFETNFDREDTTLDFLDEERIFFDAELTNRCKQLGLQTDTLDTEELIRLAESAILGHLSSASTSEKTTSRYIQKLIVEVSFYLNQWAFLTGQLNYLNVGRDLFNEKPQIENDLIKVREQLWMSKLLPLLDGQKRVNLVVCGINHFRSGGLGTQFEANECLVERVTFDEHTPYTRLDLTVNEVARQSMVFKGTSPIPKELITILQTLANSESMSPMQVLEQRAKLRMILHELQMLDGKIFMDFVRHLDPELQIILKIELNALSMLILNGLFPITNILFLMSPPFFRVTLGDSTLYILGSIHTETPWQIVRTSPEAHVTEDVDTILDRTSDTPTVMATTFKDVDLIQISRTIFSICSKKEAFFALIEEMFEELELVHPQILKLLNAFLRDSIAKVHDTIKNIKLPHDLQKAIPILLPILFRNYQKLDPYINKVDIADDVMPFSRDSSPRDLVWLEQIATMLDGEKKENLIVCSLSHLIESGLPYSVERNNPAIKIEPVRLPMLSVIKSKEETDSMQDHEPLQITLMKWLYGASTV